MYFRLERLGLKIVVSGNPTDTSFYPPDPKNFMDYIGAEIVQVQFP